MANEPVKLLQEYYLPREPHQVASSTFQGWLLFTVLIGLSLFLVSYFGV